MSFFLPCVGPGGFPGVQRPGVNGVEMKGKGFDVELLNVTRDGWRILGISIDGEKSPSECTIRMKSRGIRDLEKV